MGRLTLNVLLSFAQFEREVIAERIRDKVTASKAKGMWMGGGVPLGYAVRDRKLIVVPDEAATVQMIMERYLACDSVRNLFNELRLDGVVSKRRQARDGSIKGGIPFRRGALYWLLSNRIYVGETVHKGTAYPGQHNAIVSRELFDAVLAKLAKSAGKSARGSRKAVSLLAGMIRDDRGRPMSPCHTRNHGRRYSYYASNMSDDASAPALRLPAGELDASVRAEVSKWLGNGEETRKLVDGLDASATSSLFDTCAALASRIMDASVGEAREILRQVNLEVRVSSSDAIATFDTRALLSMAGLDGVDGTAVTLIIPTTEASYGHEPRLRLEPAGNHAAPRDERLVELIARGFAARDQLLEMEADGAAAMPVTRLRHLQRTARMSYLDPEIIRSILNGTQPGHLSARALWRMADLPLGWAAQRQALQFPAT